MKWAAKLLLGRGSKAALRSELCSLWQAELATPKMGAACSRICSNQELATPSLALGFPCRNSVRTVRALD